MNRVKKVLFVDDDPDILTIARYCFDEIDGVEVKFLNSGEKAVKEALSYRPDLIILDVMMPGMDGIDTFKALKFMPGLGEIPVIFITAKLQKHQIDEYYKLGVIDVIEKPFTPEHIRETVAKRLSNA